MKWLIIILLFLFTCTKKELKTAVVLGSNTTYKIVVTTIDGNIANYPAIPNLYFEGDTVVGYITYSPFYKISYFKIIGKYKNE